MTIILFTSHDEEIPDMDAMTEKFQNGDVL